MNQFSNIITKILEYSRHEAEKHSSAVILPEHLLLGLLHDDIDCINDVMIQMNVNTAEIREKLENRIFTYPASVTMPDNIRLSDIATNIIKRSVLEARLQKLSTIEPYHILLAILHDSMDNGAKSVLREYNICYNDVQNIFQTTPTNDVTDNINDAVEDIAGSERSEDKHNPFTSGSAEPRPAKDEIFRDDDDENDNSEDLEDSGEDLVKAGHSARMAKEKKRTTKSSTPALDKFSTDLTQAAAESKLDPVVGREKEMQRVMEIICRRKKNNPVLIGDPGVGKSAIVEGLAQMIQRHDVSPILFNRRLLALDLTAVVAGTKYRGQFEERIKLIIEELEQHPEIIIFIDEIHTMIGAGSAEGTMDAANILKPALARGTIQCIGATTLDEYRKSIEKDGALERRFQKVIVEPATADETIRILQNLKPRYEKFHHVEYTEEAIAACVKLTGRFITDRAFPDKAIDAMDEAGSRLHLSSATVPPEIKQLEKEIEELNKKKKSAVFNQNYELAASYRDRQIEITEQLDNIRKNWEEGNTDERMTVSEENIAEVVSMMSGIPSQRIADDENVKLKKLHEILEGRVIGQDNAIRKVAKAIQRNRLGLHSPDRPIGAFMFLGPTGVGKTYLAQQLAIEIFGSGDALIRVDMSEYNESFNTSRLVGAPPGYVGYDEGGQLTERVRRHPYSIVLLDEIEKAHPNVYNILLQVLDEGRLTDGNGRLVDFRNTIIIMTSNAGTRQLKDFGRGVGFQNSSPKAFDLGDSDREHARSIIQKALSKQFSPEFLNRLDEIITFDQLDLESIKKIIRLELKPLEKRIEEMGYKLQLTDEAMNLIAEKGYDIQYGARPLKRALQSYVEDYVCSKILDGIAVGETITIDKDAIKENDQ